jgi:Fe-S cluster assembly iron-binding protein IscA
MEYLRGSTINYADTLISAGFQIENPNVKRKCGCGSSVDF